MKEETRDKWKLPIMRVFIIRNFIIFVHYSNLVGFPCILLSSKLKNQWCGRRKRWTRESQLAIVLLLSFVLILRNFIIFVRRVSRL